MSAARRLISPCRRIGLLNARALDDAMIVLSRSKKAATRPWELTGEPLDSATRSRIEG